MDFFNEIWLTISKNRSRSLLTGFGVFWGMMILLALVAVGDSLKSAVWSNIAGFATNSTFIGTSTTSKPYKGLQKGREWDIVNSDLPVLRREAPSADIISSLCFGGLWENNVRYGDRKGSYQQIGVESDFSKVMYVPILYGRNINDIDIRECRKVCVIGNRIYRELFPEGGDVTGRMLSIGNIQFRIVGVRRQAKMDVNIGGPPDELVVLPITTLQQTYHLGETIHMVMATAKPQTTATEVEDEIKSTLKQLHSVAPDDQRATWSVNMEEMFKANQSLMLGLTILIWLVGIGTLISGAVGVSNIMLVTVRERTKEIGIRRALGASPRVIVRQILAESTLLTFLAGVLGIVAGVGVVQLAGMLLKDNEMFGTMQVSFSVAVCALILLILIGLLAGLLPASRALSIKPIEALSEE